MDERYKEIVDNELKKASTGAVDAFMIAFLEILFELFQHITSGGVLIHDFRMLMTELAPFHHSLILSGLWLEKLLLVPVGIIGNLKPWVNADG